MKTTDLIVVCGSRQFPVHKEKLRQVSPAFAAILENLDEGGCVDVNNNDSNEMRKVQDRVIVDNVNEHIFEKILNYIYSGSIEFANDYIEVLMASDLYEVNPYYKKLTFIQRLKIVQISSLKGVCETALIGQLSPVLVSDYLHAADLTSSHKLKSAALKYCTLYKEYIFKVIFAF